MLGMGACDEVGLGHPLGQKGTSNGAAHHATLASDKDFGGW
jgi:hypothetical protein